MKKNTITVLCSIVTIIIIVLYYVPFKNVGTFEYGVIIGKYSKKIDKENIYSSGKYFVGYVSDLIYIPKSNIIITYGDKVDGKNVLTKIEAKTKESSSIIITCSIMYKYIPGQLSNLFDRWLDLEKHLDDIKKGARNTIILAINTFSYEEILKNRTEFEKRYKL